MIEKGERKIPVTTEKVENSNWLQQLLEEVVDESDIQIYNGDNVGSRD